METTTFSDSARQWGTLWGDRPRDWAVSEEQQAPVYEETLGALRVGGGDRVLDVGCGTGVFLRLCADRGASVSGIDASEGLLELARRRVPEADLRHGDMQFLPYEDDSFDFVTGFTSFFFADDIVEALREAARVVRPGGAVAIEVFGRPEHCALESMKAAVAQFRPGEEAYWRPGVVEEIVPQAGLAVERVFDTNSTFEYADDAALVSAMTAAGGAGLVAGPDRQDELAAAILRELRYCKRPDGGFSLQNEWHVVIARAR